MPRPVVTTFGADTGPLKAGVREAQLQLAKYDASVRESSAAQQRLSASNERWARSLTSVAKTAGIVGAVGIAGLTTALAGAAVSAAKFDAAMRNVNSISGLSQKQFVALEGRVKNLSLAVGKSPTDLANGLYSIVSSGFKANDAMKILTAGAKAARAGLTDTATATGVITAALNTYGLGANSARKVSDLLFQDVNVGVLNFQQLAGSMGKVLPQAKALGVSLSEVTAAQAALTLGGVSADESTVQLSSIMTAFVKPSKAFTAQLKSMGFESGQAAIAHLGFKGALDAVGKASHGNQALLAEWFKNIRAFRGVAGLEGSTAALEHYRRATDAMAVATKGAGETQAVYNEQQKSTAAQFDHLKAAVDVAAITIGTALLPEINKGITALSKWLAQAQKSGELAHFAQTIASDVKVAVAFLESLGPEARKTISVIEQTIQAAIPYVKDLARTIEAVAPELEAVGRAAGGVASALGPAPILGAAAAYLALRRATLQGQVAMGGYAKVMKAGSEAAALAGGGAVSATGKIDAVGKAAIAAESNAKLFARGLVKSFGPQILAAGAAGIILSIIAIKGSMTDLKNEVQDVVDALAELQGDRIDVAAARIARARADTRLTVAQNTAGSRAVDLNRVISNDQRPTALRLAAPTPAEIKATNDLAAANLTLRDALNERDRADAVAAAAEGKRAGDRQKLAQQLEGAGQKAIEQNQHHQLTTDQAPGGRFGPDSLTAAERQKKAVDDLVSSLRKQFDAEKGLDVAGRAAGNRVADVIALIGRIPTTTQYKIIADDVAAGKSLARIKRDLGLLDKTKVTPTISADTAPADDATHRVKLELDAATKARTVHIRADTSAVTAAVQAVNRNILHLTSTPFTVHINEAAGRTGHFNTKGQWVYSRGGSFISGAYGADDVPVMVTGQEAILNPRQIAMVDSGAYTVRGALDATGAQTIRRGGGYASGGLGGGLGGAFGAGRAGGSPDVLLLGQINALKATLTREQKHLDPLSLRIASIADEIKTKRAHMPSTKLKAAHADAEHTIQGLTKDEGKLRTQLSRAEVAQRDELSKMQTRYQSLTSQAPGATPFARSVNAANVALASAQQGGGSINGPTRVLIKLYAQRLIALSQAKARKPGTLVLDQINQEIAADLGQLASLNASIGIGPGATASGPSLGDLKPTQGYLTDADQFALDRALLPDENGNASDPVTAARILNSELAHQEKLVAALSARGLFASADAVTQDESNVRSTLASLATTPAGPSADTQAQLTQSQAQVLALTRGAGFGAAAASAFSQGGLGMLTVLGDQRSLGAIAGAAAKGFSAQPYIASNAGSLTI